MNESENIRKLRNRNIFEEIKKRTTQIKETALESESPEKTHSKDTFEDIIKEVFGDE